MKKSFLIAIACAALCSCGPTEAPSVGDQTAQLEKSVGEIKSLNPEETLSQEETLVVMAVCQDLERKKQYLSDFVDTARKIQYTSSTKSCGQDTATEQSPFFVTVSNNSGRLEFEGDAPFKNVVVNDNDVMGAVCSHVRGAANNGELPKRNIEYGDVVWIYASPEGGRNCPRADQANCIFLETGIFTGGATDRFRIRDAKSFSVARGLDASERGFVIERRQATICPGDELTTSLLEMTFVGAEG